MNSTAHLQQQTRKHRLVILAFGIAVVAMAFVCLFVGSSNMTLSQGFSALLGKGTAAQVRIIRGIRIPRVLAAIIAGAGLSVSGLIMQTTLNNSMASPSTLGVSNAAVFGANLSIIAFAGGFLSTGNNIQNFDVGANPYATSLLAFLFSALSILLILGLCTVRSFSPSFSSLPLILAMRAKMTTPCSIGPAKSSSRKAAPGRPKLRPGPRSTPPCMVASARQVTTPPHSMMTRHPAA